MHIDRMPPLIRAAFEAQAPMNSSKSAPDVQERVDWLLQQNKLISDSLLNASATIEALARRVAELERKETRRGDE